MQYGLLINAQAEERSLLRSVGGTRDGRDGVRISETLTQFCVPESLSPRVTLAVSSQVSVVLFSLLLYHFPDYN